MNVNPVATPGPTPPTPIATSPENRQASMSGQDRGSVRQSPPAASAEPKNKAARATVDQESSATRADRQKAEQLKAFIGDNNMRLSTYHDEASGRSILEVRDQTTGDIVSQYPSEELIRLYAALRQPLVDQSA